MSIKFNKKNQLKMKKILFLLFNNNIKNMKVWLNKIMKFKKRLINSNQN